ncbi:MAG: hypothetical protein MPW14_25970 (plasmid) [Candidatus Manganitrophus sp.]|nr:MAG: hypothetical protein MPW14_25970 [Candidatus Manganitrophus sp.]
MSEPGESIIGYVIKVELLDGTVHLHEEQASSVGRPRHRKQRSIDLIEFQIPALFGTGIPEQRSLDPGSRRRGQ